MEAPSCHRQHLRTRQWPQPLSQSSLIPSPSLPLRPHTPGLFLTWGTASHPVTSQLQLGHLLGIPAPHPTLPLPPSSAPSRPSPSRGCNIRFTIWGLSCYNNRRRLCCEEQLAPCAASRAASILQPGRRPSLLPPSPSRPLPGVCVCIRVPRLAPAGTV